MTHMLASITSMAEAHIVMTAGADIVDLKDPSRGALGAVDTRVVRDVVQMVDGSCLTSATIGDLPMQPAGLGRAIHEMAGTGVDIVKVGLFAQHLGGEILSVLARQAEQGVAIVLVCFADRDFGGLDYRAVRRAGISGIMLDTADKSRGNLLSCASHAMLEDFIKGARQAGLLAGLAGSLRRGDIPLLLPLEPDYLGFRGALCRGNIRESTVDQEAVRQIRSMIAIDKDETPVVVTSGG